VKAACRPAGLAVCSPACPAGPSVRSAGPSVRSAGTQIDEIFRIDPEPRRF